MNVLFMLNILEVLLDSDPIIIERMKKYKKKYGWWAKHGHWCHTSFWKAMDHLIRGGQIKFGRW